MAQEWGVFKKMTSQIQDALAWIGPGLRRLP